MIWKVLIIANLILNALCVWTINKNMESLWSIVNILDVVIKMLGGGGGSDDDLPGV